MHQQEEKVKEREVADCGGANKFHVPPKQALVKEAVPYQLLQERKINIRLDIMN